MWSVALEGEPNGLPTAVPAVDCRRVTAALGRPSIPEATMQPLITHRSLVKPPCDGPQLLRDPMYNKGAAFSHAGTGAVRSARPDAAGSADDRGAGRPGTGAPAVEGRRPGEVHRPVRPPGPQRNALLPPAGREPRGTAAHRLHADRGACLPAVQPHLPAASRHLDHAGRRGPHPGPAPQRPAAGRPADRGHRQRADPGTGGPGRGRHGHPRGQAVALHAPRPASIPGTACR